MKTDSVVNMAALAALCGTAGVASYFNAQRKRERDEDKIRNVLIELQQREQGSFDKEAYCKRYFIRKEAAKVLLPHENPLPVAKQTGFDPTVLAVGLCAVPAVKSATPSKTPDNTADNNKA